LARIPSRCAVSALKRRSVSTPTTVTQTSPTLIRYPSGWAVVKNRDRTPLPMMATGSPRST
jgi:hypothetical protein